MFENQNPPAGGANQGITPPVSPAGTIPMPTSTAPQSAMPTGGSAPLTGKPATPPDMFSEVEPVAAAAPAGAWQRPAPKPPVFQPKPAPAAGGPAAPYNFEEAAPKTDLKKLLVLGGLVLLLAAIVAGGYFGYKKYSAAGTGSENNALAPEAKTENKQEAAIIESGNKNTQPEAATEPQPAVAGETGSVATGTAAAPKDSDDDGLTDAEEAGLGTSPNAVDSDGDGLFDREEVKVYGTDPLKADTDGDGYADGQEVKGGFNPLGWGKLFDASNPVVNKK